MRLPKVGVVVAFPWSLFTCIKTHTFSEAQPAAYMAHDPRGLVDCRGFEGVDARGLRGLAA